MPEDVLDATVVRVKDVDAKHIDWKLRIEAWRDLAILHEGGHTIKKCPERFLKLRPSEDSDVYAARLDRFTYQNLLGAAIGWYLSAMFKEPPQIFFGSSDSEKKILKEVSSFYVDEFLNNADGAGRSYTDVWKKLFVSLCVFGRAFALTDLNKDDDPPPTTKQDQIDRGLLDPHVVVYDPLSVINWREDSLGNLFWVMVKSTLIEQESPFTKAKTVDYWYYFTQTEYSVYRRERKEEEGEETIDQDDNVFLVNSGRHALASFERVPVRKFEFPEGLWLADRVYLPLIDHLNQDNTLSWALFMSNLAMPVIISDADIDATSTEAGYIKLPSGSSYQWSEPEGNSFEHSANRLENLREEIFRTMYLLNQGRSAKATPALQSGRSKEIDMMPSTDVLSLMGGTICDGMQNLLADVSDARKDDIELDVRGPRFYNEMSTEEVFAMTTTIRLGVPSDTFEREMYKKMARNWMRGKNPDLLLKIDDEIDAGPLLREREQKMMEQSAEITGKGVSSALSRVPSPPGRGTSVQEQKRIR